MNYIFCGSYRGLLFALHIKSLGEKITVLVYHQDIIKYCIAEKIDYIQIKRIRPNIQSLHDVFTLKEMIDDVIEKINFGKDDKFYLTGNSTSYDAFYLAKELSKKGNVYYKNSDVEFKIYNLPKFKPIFLRGTVVNSLLKIVLDLDLIYRDKRGDPALGIDDTFLNKNNIKIYAPNKTSEELILDALKKNKVEYKSYDNLIVDQGPMAEIIKYGSMEKLFKNLFKLPVKFALKKHPIQSKVQTYSFYYDLFNNCDEIPRYIPAELFYNNIRKNVISIFSIATAIAAKLKHLKAISLLELVDWHNKSFKEDCKDLLIETSDNKILFPKNFEELKEMLSEK